MSGEESNPAGPGNDPIAKPTSPEAGPVTHSRESDEGTSARASANDEPNAEATSGSHTAHDGNGSEPEETPAHNPQEAAGDEKPNRDQPPSDPEPGDANDPRGHEAAGEDTSAPKAPATNASPFQQALTWVKRMLEPSRAAPDVDQELERARVNPWGIAARSELLALLLGISLVAWAQFSFDADWVVQFLTKNRLGLDKRMTLITSMLIGGASAALICAGALGYRAKKELSFEVVERWLWFLSPLTLAPTLPLLLRYRAWEDNHEELLPALLFVGLVLELFLFKCFKSVPPAAARAYQALVKETPGFLRRHGPVLVVVGGAVAYAIFMSFYTIRWHQKMGTGNYDLGINNNLMYGGLFGDFNQSRIVFPFEPQKYIANHVKIGAYFFLPIYALAPRPETLQVIQSTLLGMSAVPLFLFGRRHVAPWMAALVALAWLSYYPLHGANFYEVKMVPIAAFFVLTAIWAADARRWVIMAIACLIGMLMREDMPIGFAVIGCFLLLSGYRPVPGLILALVASGWFVLLRFQIMEEAGQWWFPKMYKDLWAEGETGFRSVIKTLVSNPFFTLKHVLIEKKIIYMMHLMVPLLFLPARRWYLWASFLPGAMLTLLVTDYKPVTMFSFQYVMHWAPYMFVAVILALAAYQRESPDGGKRAQAALLATVFSVGVLSFNYGAFPRRDGALKSGYHSITFSMSDSERERYADLQKIIRDIPPDASVAASEKIGPHVSSRRVFYSLRRDSYHADYLIVQQRGLRLDRTKRVITNALTSGEYGVYRRVGPFALLKRGHSTRGNDALIDEWRLQRPRSHTSSRHEPSEPDEPEAGGEEISDEVPRGEPQRPLRRPRPSIKRKLGD